MKNFTRLTLLFIVITSLANAQVTIQTQDMPGVGSNYTMSHGVTFTGIDIVGTGANHTWDFTQLGRSGQEIDSVISPTQTDQVLGFYFIDISFNTNRANLAQKGGAINLGATGLTNVYNYYFNSQSAFEQPGFGAVANGVPLPIPYTPHDFIYRFPMNFSNTDSCAYTYVVDLSAVVGIYYSVDRSRHNEVDGWGTLMTPFGTFNALRVKSTIVEQDSFYVDTFGFGYKTPPTTTFEYKWLAPGKGLPLLQINASATNAITNILYQDSTHTIGINEIDAIINDAVVFPNPVTTKFYVKYDLLHKGDVSFELFSAEGKRVFEMKEEGHVGDNIKSFDLNGYQVPAGNYFLKIHSPGSEIIKQVQIQ